MRWTSHRAILTFLILECCIESLSFTNGMPEAVRPEYRLAEIRLLRTDGVHVAGQLLSISPDSIVLKVPDGLIILGRNEIASIVMANEFHPGSLLIGAYLGLTATAATTSTTPGWFFTLSPREPATPTYLSFGFVALGVVLEPVLQGSQKTFRVNGENGEHEWRCLEYRVSTLVDDDAWEYEGRYHVIVAGGAVLVPSAVDWPLFSEQGDEESTSSNVNLLRSFSVGYTLSDCMDIGVRFMLLNEPGRDNNSHSIEWAAGTVTVKHYRFEGHALFLTIDTRPFAGVVKRPWSFHLGGGAGLGRCAYDVRNEVLDRMDGEWPTASTETEHSTDDSGLALTVFSGIDLFVQDDLSLGLAADYTFLPGVKLEGMPAWGLSGGTAGNFSVGFELGVHF